MSAVRPSSASEEVIQSPENKDHAAHAPTVELLPEELGAQAVALHEDLRRRAERVVGTAADSRVIKLFGQASNRVYYRIEDGQSSVVAMVMPVGAKGSEEIGGGSGDGELPFLNVQRYLEGLSLRVPQVFEYDEAAGILLLEDLGDRTFESALEPVPLDSPRNVELYSQAVDLLAKLRARAEQKPDSSCVAFGREFDRELFFWEFEHFHEWGLLARGAKVSLADQELLRRFYGQISDELATLPRGFTHRDFQSRNLMLKNQELVLIDFQDALLAPLHYDLVALLRDSYVELPWPMVEGLVWRFCDAFEAQGGEIGDRQAFLRHFHLLTVQRKLKDGGRFVFIDRVKGNPNFLPSIPASFCHVKGAIAQLPELREMGEVLARYLPEWGED